MSSYLALLFIPLFIGFWFLIVSILGAMSGWYDLAKRFPNTPERAILRLNWQSGSMGLGVNMNRILKLAVCPSGLRIGIWRLFGPFSRDFVVPWSDIRIIRRNRLLWKIADIRLGDPAIGRLRIPAHVANRLAAAASERWPEVGVFLPETTGQAFVRIGGQWLFGTTLASLFFILVPRLAIPEAGAAYPPIAVAILFPAIVLGIGSIISFFGSLRQ